MTSISRPISVEGCSWESPSSSKSVIISEIQVNEEVVFDVHRNGELDDVSEDGDQKIT